MDGSRRIILLNRENNYSCFAWRSPEEARYMNRAEKRRQRKLAEKAAKNTKPIQSQSPSPGHQTPYIQQFLQLAAHHHKMGDLPKAEETYQQILETDPNQPIA